MASTIKLRTLLKLIDEYTTVYFVITKDRKPCWHSEGDICSKAIQKYKELLSYDILEISTDSEGAICIEIKKP